jgi:hypothetical protein
MAFPFTRLTAREQLSKWFKLPESVRAFENLQQDVLELFRRAFGDAPTDGATYGRKNGAWAAIVASLASVTEAPLDGALYGRQAGAWAPVLIPDDLAPPVVPFVPDDAEALRTEVAELRAQFAVMETAIQGLQQGTSP